MTNGIASPVEIYVEISRGGRERRIRGMDSCDTIRHPESPSPEDEQRSSRYSASTILLSAKD